MIISHEHQFIFIKTSKTASTSVEIALSQFCGPKDIITPIAATDESIRHNNGGRSAQNHLDSPWNYRPRDIQKLIKTGQKKKRFYNHISASEIRPKISPTVWNSYYKFCVERNPWDRVISMYHWRLKRSGRQFSLTDFIDSGILNRIKSRGYGLYTINNQVIADKICLFEDLANDLDKVRQQIGLPKPLELPRAKSNFRKDKRSYRDVLTEQQKNKISEIFSEEISLFGYSF